MFRSWWSCRTVSNHGSGFQIPGVPESCHFFLLADHAVVLAVGLPTPEEVVAPRHVVAVQQIGEIGPRVVGLAVRRVLRLVRRRERVLQRVHAARGVMRPVAAGRPLRDQVQLRGQAPRRDRLEQVVPQHEVARVGPVVRDLALVVVAHHVRLRGRERAERRVGRGHAAGDAAGPRLADEAVHLAAVHVAHGVQVLVRAAAVPVARVVVRVDADMRARVGHADREAAVAPRQPVGSRVRPEIGVERAVLLHDHDHVADLVDPLRVRAWSLCPPEEHDPRDESDREREGHR
jgi:hypothetical protein